MYYDTIEEAIKAAPNCTHVLTPSLDWTGRKDIKGKFCTAERSSNGYFYRVQDGARLHLSGAGWEVAKRILTQPTPEQRVTAARFDQAATERQVCGDHYKSLKIQPIEYIDANNLPYLEGNVVKYVTRHASKNGVQDIDKAIHYLELIKQMRYSEDNTSDN